MQFQGGMIACQNLQNKQNKEVVMKNKEQDTSTIYEKLGKDLIELTLKYEDKMKIEDFFYHMIAGLAIGALQCAPNEEAAFELFKISSAAALYKKSCEENCVSDKD